jgi:type II secretory pathway pseudopilin PulG
MIELLMVILLVGVLSAVALPAYLDFRQEGRAASVRQSLAALRVGLKNQKAQMILRCGKTAANWPTEDEIENNDVTFNGTCTTTQIPNAAERKFVADGGIPTNPFVSANPADKPAGKIGGFNQTQESANIASFGGSFPVGTSAVCITAKADWMPRALNIDWGYNTDTGEFFPGTWTGASTGTPYTGGIKECDF